MNDCFARVPLLVCSCVGCSRWRAHDRLVVVTGFFFLSLGLWFWPRAPGLGCSSLLAWCVRFPARVL